MKERLDVLLVKKNLASSREKAKALIMSGIVYVDGQKEDKAGAAFDENALVELKGSTLKYVSRGGLKLEKALMVFPIELKDRICMDIGASTGGFTDCMLKNGACKVYAIDVGYGQLDWSLRNDSRVICMEKTNFRYTVKTDIPDEISFAACDVAFISISKILKPAYDILSDDGEMVCLIKPQFEAGRDKVGKKGVVKDKAIHEEVIRSCIGYALSAGFAAEDISGSPIKGPEGNIEYLMYLKKSGEDKSEALLLNIGKEVEKTHEEFLCNSKQSEG